VNNRQRRLRGLPPTGAAHGPRISPSSRIVEGLDLPGNDTAYASAAIPETLGDAGIVWPEHNALLMAESIDRLIRDKSVRDALGERGYRRYESTFTNRIVERIFLQAMSKLK